MHLDSWMAAQRRFIALTDYQALARMFPVTYQPKISVEAQYQLWDLENDTSKTAPQALRTLLKSFPVPIDYVVVFGDGTPGREAEVATLLTEFGTSMKLVDADPGNEFVRV